MRQLFERMRSGDRDAAAEFMIRYGGRIRRRIRGKMNTPMRRMFDSQEIVATVCRRLDRFVHIQAVSARSEAEFWGFVFELAHRAVVDKVRAFDRLLRIESADSEFTFLLSQQLKERPYSDLELEMRLDVAIERVHNPMDREVLHFWLQGKKFAEISELVDLSPAAVRKRWERICEILKEAMNEGQPGPTGHG